MKADDLVTQVRLEMTRQRRTAASVALQLGHTDKGRKLRRQLRGEQEFRVGELAEVGRVLGLQLTVREDPS